MQTHYAQHSCAELFPSLKQLCQNSMMKQRTRFFLNWWRMWIYKNNNSGYVCAVLGLCVSVYYFEGMCECVSMFVLHCSIITVLHYLRHLECIYIYTIQIPFWLINMKVEHRSSSNKSGVIHWSWHLAVCIGKGMGKMQLNDSEIKNLTHDTQSYILTHHRLKQGTFESKYIFLNRK